MNTSNVDVDQNHSSRVGQASQEEAGTSMNDKVGALNKVSDAHSRFKPLGLELDDSR